MSSPASLFSRWLLKGSRSSHRFDLLVVGFFAVLLVVGLIASRGYGISWDEKTQYTLGVDAFKSVFHQAPWPIDQGRRFHGTFIEFLLVCIQYVLGLQDAREIFLMRHAATFLLFFAGVVGFYFLARSYTRSSALGLLGAVFLVLSPRIFAHAFYNTRDIPAMVLFIFAILALRQFVDRPTELRAGLHALVTAMLLAVRLTGLLIPILTLLFLARAVLFPTESTQMHPPRRALELAALYLLLTIAFTIIAWPLLWTSPWQNFLAGYEQMSTMVAGGGFHGFYMGKMHNGLLWHWIPVWISITTPLPYSAFFLIGLVSVLWRMLRRPIALLCSEIDNILILLWLIAPIVSIFFFHAGIYDTWRHLYFIYPAFLLLSLSGLQWIVAVLRQRLRWGQIAAIILALSVTANLCFTAFWMIRNHPLQDLYFSIPARFVEGNFELDYWGVSYRKAIEYVLAHDPELVIAFVFSGSAGYSSIMILPPEDRRRIAYGEVDTYKYIIDNFRWQNYQHVFSDDDKVYSVEVDGMEIINVYRNPLWKPANASARFPLGVWNPYQDILNGAL